jgi:SAM-dependent methyltransferase
MTEEAVAWLVQNRQLLPRTGAALDLACGRGRHALWLAAQGFRASAVDNNAEALRHLADEARSRGLSIAIAVADLEGGETVVREDTLDVIVAVHYLHRPLFPQLIDALRPGGVLVYETFTTAQAARGKPTNPAFLLRPGELLELIRPLSVLASREGEFDGRDVASVVARKPYGPP